MKIKEAINHIETSDFSEATKSKMKKVIDGLDENSDLEPTTSFQINEIMQEEIEKDISESDVDTSQEPEIIVTQKEYEKTLEQIDEELNKDMKQAEEQKNLLTEASKAVLKRVDEFEAEELKNSIFKE